MAPALARVGSSVPLAHKESIKMHTIDEIAASSISQNRSRGGATLTNISGAALTRLKQINEKWAEWLGRPQEQPEVEPTEPEEVDESGGGEPAPEDPPPGSVLPRRRL